MKLSIIIPTFNRLWSLPDALASCPRSSEVEIIVIDDGSTDGTFEWLKEQPGIIAIKQVNEGKPSAVNRGYLRASGEYIKFLDSDDMTIPDELIGQLGLGLETSSDIIVAGYVSRTDGGMNDCLRPWVDSGDFLAQQLGECDSSHYSAFIFKRRFIEDIRHRPEFGFRDDRMFIIECALRRPTVEVWPKPTLIHRHHKKGRIQHQTGLASFVTDWQEMIMFMMVANVLETTGQSTHRRRQAIVKNLWRLMVRVAAKSRKDGKAILRFINRLDPNFKEPLYGQGRIYRVLGYSLTQPIMAFARMSINIYRELRRIF